MILDIDREVIINNKDIYYLKYININKEFKDANIFIDRVIYRNITYKINLVFVKEPITDKYTLYLSQFYHDPNVPEQDNLVGCAIAILNMIFVIHPLS